MNSTLIKQMGAKIAFTNTVMRMYAHIRIIMNVAVRCDVFMLIMCSLYKYLWSGTYTAYGDIRVNKH